MAGSSKEEFTKVQEEIKQAGLNDFLSWVKECATNLNKVNGQGDTKEVFEIVNHMQGKPGKPPRNITTDEKGNLLIDAKAKAAR